MEDELNLLIEEAIRLEQNVAELYLLFHRLFPEDAQFWWRLSMEEQNHAALLKTVSQMNDTRIQIPKDILPCQLKELKNVNRLLRSAMEELASSPDRTRAFQLAYTIENSAGELHYDKFMKYGTRSQISEVFRKLNGDDMDHAARILHYMKQRNMELPV
jgi:ferritin